MPKIYIVLTHTGTVLSKIIHIYTGDEYSHVSVSLDKDLKQMYSFGRLNPNNPFIGGFVHEGINIGTFKKFYKTRTKIVEIEVTEEQYQNLARNISELKEKKELYKFNRIGLVAAGLNIKFEQKKRFYCAEFVKYILKVSGIEFEELPEIIKPEDFKNIKKSKLIYIGILRDYNKTKEIV